MDLVLLGKELGWVKSRDRYRRIASKKELSLRFESLACVGDHISLENTEICLHRPCVRCATIRILRLAFIRLTFVPHGTAECLARVDCVRWTLSIGNWRFCPSKEKRNVPKCVENAPRMRRKCAEHLWGENTFWTIPILPSDLQPCEGNPVKHRLSKAICEEVWSCDGPREPQDQKSPTKIK